MLLGRDNHPWFVEKPKRKRKNRIDFDFDKMMRLMKEEYFDNIGGNNGKTK